MTEISHNLSLAVVCPMASEGSAAVTFVNAVLDQCREFRTRRFLAILDHASKDNTRELLSEHAKTVSDLNVIWAPENRNVVDAYVRGYCEALALQPDWILEIDAGFSHRPSDIPQFFAKMAEGYDCVFGSRFCPGGAMDANIARYWLSYGGTVLANLLLGTQLRDMTSGFELFTRESLEFVLRRGIKSHGPFFQTEIKTYCRHLAIAEVPIHYRAPSHPIGRPAVTDALRNLWRLFRLRLAGQA